MIPDDVPGGFWAENGFDRPRKFYSKAEHRAALTAEGCELRVKYAGEHDKHVTNWAAAVDAKTLENAAVLLSRGKIQIDRPEPETLEPIAKRSVPGPIPDGVQHG
ncbi:MAG TPA: hypothetical protein VEA16_10950 [Vicinamibacterales bacterium]|nr:hypothetical protein [Vicinamibacterales bacterium]